MTGRTKSTNFPITTGAFRTTFSGVFDAFVTKIPLADVVERTMQVAPDATSGTPPYTAASSEYHPGADSNNYHPSATPDPTVLPDRATEIWAKYYWATRPGGWAVSINRAFAWESLHMRVRFESPNR